MSLGVRSWKPVGWGWDAADLEWDDAWLSHGQRL